MTRPRPGLARVCRCVPSASCREVCDVILCHCTCCRVLFKIYFCGYLRLFTWFQHQGILRELSFFLHTYNQLSVNFIACVSMEFFIETNLCLRSSFPSPADVTHSFSLHATLSWGPRDTVLRDGPCSVLHLHSRVM